MGILANNEDPDEMLQSSSRERSGSVVECLTGDRGPQV